MRKQFEAQLEDLNMRLIKMGALCETAIARAIRALLNKDDELAQQVIDNEKDINHAEKEIENLCLKLLLQQQPVASDLRVISAALKMITDMERIGDQAEEIAVIVKRANLSDTIQTLHLKDMAMATIKLVNDSIDAYVRRDLELAQAVIKGDDVIDNQFKDIKENLIEMIRNQCQNASMAIDIIMIAKYLERIGDHATNIAEWVVFSITGIHKEGKEI
ncbi:MAG: phosphate signaling complex protein PhoU [Erysipelotrichaceae bacterium]|nr:phosphate signaling complex protein PhoU [Erysipelotrichaceae bacterium]MDD3923940.1 phosphate signaling complex protein PhoU [Erysipelotrichaceae bacterium]MDD4643311.1 phosphate signaling complex protein PhoU [Erysipelotrichaceae bacterium]